MMNNAALQMQLNKTTTDIFIKWNDTPTMRKLLILLYAYEYNFVNKKNFNTDQPCSDLKKEMETDFYKWYHGNSKPILHIFYNNITCKNELQLTTQSIIKTYPQHRNAKIYNYWA